MTWTKEHKQRWHAKEENREKNRARSRAYYQKNKEKQKAQMAAWRKKNKDKISEYQKKWYRSESGRAYLERTRVKRTKQQLRRWALDPAKYIESSRRWYHSPAGQAYMAAYRKRNTAKRIAHNQKWSRNNRAKTRTYYYVQKALKSGQISKQPCAECGAVRDVRAAHNDYKKPLDITWLCRAHHMARKRRMPSLAKRLLVLAKAVV